MQQYTKCAVWSFVFGVRQLVLWMALRKCNRAHEFSFCDLLNSHKRDVRSPCFLYIYTHVYIHILQFTYLPLSVVEWYRNKERKNEKQKHQPTNYESGNAIEGKISLILFLTYTRQSSAITIKPFKNHTPTFYIDCCIVL